MPTSGKGSRGWLADAVRRLSAQPAPLLVSAHWGPNMTAGPQRYIRRAAGELRALGAHLVVGHSAHVVHGVTDGVLFDLGDFLDDYATDPVMRNDLGLLWLLNLDENVVTHVQAIPLHLGDRHTALARGHLCGTDPPAVPPPVRRVGDGRRRCRRAAGRDDEPMMSRRAWALAAGVARSVPVAGGRGRDPCPSPGRCRAAVGERGQIRTALRPQPAGVARSVPPSCRSRRAWPDPYRPPAAAGERGQIRTALLPQPASVARSAPPSPAGVARSVPVIGERGQIRTALRPQPAGVARSVPVIGERGQIRTALRPQPASVARSAPPNVSTIRSWGTKTGHASTLASGHARREMPRTVGARRA